ncbi:transcriptional regulator [Candidatus Symbiopectobacterium sp. 'North America']|nr:transcriptional regulator [Candidatus Symbiopectobacterium sp. 'North America']
MQNTGDTTRLFGQRIKTLRVQAGLTQMALASRCNLDRTYLSGIERGVRNPTLEIISIIAAGLGTSLAALFDYLFSPIVSCSPSTPRFPLQPLSLVSFKHLAN